MTPLEAVGATRFHHQLLPRFDHDKHCQPLARPDQVSTRGAWLPGGAHDWEFGDVQVIWRDGDTLRPAADPETGALVKSLPRLMRNKLKTPGFVHKRQKIG